MQKVKDALILYISLACVTPAYAQNSLSIQQGYSDIVAADQAIQHKQYKKGIALYRKYLKKFPDDKNVVITLLRLQLSQGNYNDAQNMFSSYESRFGKDEAYLAEKARYFVLVDKSAEASKTLNDYQQHTIDSLPSLAQSAIQNKNYEQAILLYRRYLSAHPNQNQVAIILLRLLLQRGNYAAAENLVADYQANLKNDVQFLIEKAKLYTLTQRSDAALEIVTPLLKKYPHSQNLRYARQFAIDQQARKKHVKQDVMLIAATDAVQNNNINNAIRFYERYLIKNPNDQSVTLSLIKLYLTANNLQAALNLLKIYPIKFGNDDAYRAQKAHYFAITRRPEDALAIIQPLLHKDPSNKDFVLINQYALTQQVKINRSQQINLSEANAAIKNKNYQKSIALYEQYMKDAPEDKAVLMTLVQLQLMQGDARSVLKLLRSYRNRFGVDDGFLTQLSRCYVLKNQPEKALILIEPLLIKDPKNKILLESKQYALNQRAYQIQITQELTLASAKQALQKRDYQRSLALYEDYLRHHPGDKNILISVVQLNLLQANFDEANQLLKGYVAKYGQDNSYLTEKARFLAMTRQTEPALSLLNQLLNTDPYNKNLIEMKQVVLKNNAQHSQVVQNLLLTAAAQAIKKHDYQKSATLYQQYLNHNPYDKSVFLSLIQLQIMMLQAGKAEKLLVQYVTKFGEDVASLTQKARLLVIKNKPDAALAVLQPLLRQKKNTELSAVENDALKLKSKNTTLDSGLLLIKAKKAIVDHDMSKAIALYQLYLTQNPGDKKTLVALIRLQINQGNHQAVNQLFSHYQNNFGKDVAVTTEQTKYYIMMNETDKAIESLNYLLSRDPHNKHLFDIKLATLALMTQQFKLNQNMLLITAKKAVNEGDLQKAILLCQQYLGKNPSDKKVWLTVIDLELKRFNVNQADKLLNNYVSNFGVDDDFLLKKANYFVVTKQPDIALSIINTLEQHNISTRLLAETKQAALNLKIKNDGEQSKPLLVRIDSKLFQKNMLAQFDQEANNVELKKSTQVYYNYLKQSPLNKKITITLIDLELKQLQLKAVNKLIIDYTKKFGQDQNILSKKAIYFALLGEFDQALAVIKKLDENNFHAPALDKIKQYAIDQSKRYQNVLVAVTSMANNTLQATDLNKNIALFEAYLIKNPKDKMAISKMIDLQLQRHNYPIVTQWLEKYGHYFGKDSNSYVILKSRLLVQTQKYDEALPLLTKLLQSNPVTNNSQLSHQVALGGEAKKFQALQKIKLVLAKEAIDKNELNSAIFHYQDYLNDSPTDKAVTIALIELQLQMGYLDDATQVLSTYKLKFGEDEAFYAEKAHHFALFSKSKQSKLLLNYLLNKDASNLTSTDAHQYDITSKYPSNVIDDHLLADANLAFQNKNYERAILLCQQHLTKYPNDKNALLTLAEIELIRANLMQALVLLTNYTQKFGSDQYYQKVEAKYLLAVQKLKSNTESDSAMSSSRDEVIKNERPILATSLPNKTKTPTNTKTMSSNVNKFKLGKIQNATLVTSQQAKQNDAKNTAACSKSNFQVAIESFYATILNADRQQIAATSSVSSSNWGYRIAIIFKSPQCRSFYDGWSVELTHLKSMFVNDVSLAKSTSNYNTIDLLKHWHLSASLLREYDFFVGGRLLSFKESWYASNNFHSVYDILNQTNSAGLFFGLKECYQIKNGLNIGAQLGCNFLVGSQKSHLNNDMTTSRIALIPGLNAKINLNYQYYALLLEAGYRIDHYFNLVDLNNDHDHNFTFAGPYLSIAYCF